MLTKTPPLFARSVHSQIAIFFYISRRRPLSTCRRVKEGNPISAEPLKRPSRGWLALELRRTTLIDLPQPGLYDNMPADPARGLFAHLCICPNGGPQRQSAEWQDAGSLWAPGTTEGAHNGEPLTAHTYGTLAFDIYFYPQIGLYVSAK